MRRWVVPLLATALAACSHPSAPSGSSAPPPAPSIGATALEAPVVPSGGTTVARATGPRFLLYAQPGPGAQRVGSLAATNDWAQPLSLPALSGFVDAEGTTWLRVRLPVRPNGSVGWVRGDQVATRELHERIVVDLSAHRLRRVAAGRTIDDLSVAVGAP